MDYKQAIAVLTKMLEERSLDAEEKEAILTAIGILDWASLGKTRLKNLAERRKERRDKSIEW